MKVLVLDTSAFIMGLDPLGLEFDSYSVPEVTEELREQTGPSFRLSMARSSNKLKVQDPSSVSLQEISVRARLLGDKLVLSKTDISVLRWRWICRERVRPLLLSVTIMLCRTLRKGSA